MVVVAVKLPSDMSLSGVNPKNEGLVMTTTPVNNKVITNILNSLRYSPRVHMANKKVNT